MDVLGGFWVGSGGRIFGFSKCVGWLYVCCVDSGLVIKVEHVVYPTVSYGSEEEGGGEKRK